MSPWLRVLLSLLAFGVSSSAATHITAQDQVYEYRDREGRTVFTNNANIAMDGEQVQPLELPALGSIDFAKATPFELKGLDERVVKAHEVLQASVQCQALRTASRIPFRTWLWRDHQLELSIAGGLFALALIVGFAWQSVWMRSLLPIAPFAGAVYLGYTSAVDTQAVVDGFTTGLRACSLDLPDGNAEKGEDVKERMSSVFDLQRRIDGAYEQQDRMVEDILSEAHR